MEEQQHSQFGFSDPRQAHIYGELVDLVGPGPAAFFQDACFLMEETTLLLSTTHVVGYLIREIESAMRGLFVSITNADNSCASEPANKHKMQIKAILRSLGMQDDEPVARAWLAFPDRLHGLAHRRGLDAPRSMDEVSEVWDGIQSILDVLLRAMRERFLEWIAVLDGLLGKAAPSSDDISTLLNRVPNNAISRGYFFDKLENPEWLKLLRDKGFFSNPPAIVRNEEEGTISFPPWPEARYLARMAEHESDLVAEIIKEMPDTDNVSVQMALADALLAMPPSIASQVVAKPRAWAESRNLLLHERLGQLIVHLANGGETDAALEIARPLLDILPDPREESLPESAQTYRLPPEPQARFDDWEYGRILREYYPALSKAAGLPALELLCDLLEKAVLHSRSSGDNEGPEDYSYIWRPAIEEHAQNLGLTLKDFLVSGVRDTAEAILQSGKASVEEVVDIFERYDWKIFQRLSLHVIRVHAEHVMPIAKARLMDRNMFNDSSLMHEYSLLLRACMGRLSKKFLTIILDWIAEGPDMDGYIIYRSRTNGITPSGEDIERHKQLWQLKRLSWIGKDNLPLEWQHRYQALIEQHGEPEHPEFSSYGETWVGPTSPKTTDELRAMPVADIVSFLEAWRPPEGVSSVPSPEGLGRALSSAIAEDPERFTLEAKRFQSLDPTYIRAFIFGLRESLRKPQSFDWEPVIELCHWVMTQPREIEDRKTEFKDADPGWGWTRKAIADLFSMGFRDIPGSVPVSLRERVWSILLPLTEDPEPTVEYEEQYGGSNMDPLTLSINTTRGEAMHAVIGYALWVRRHLEEQAEAEPVLARGFDNMPEVREVLDSHLDIAREPSLAIRAVYGCNFPSLVFLDSGWADDKAELIFPIHGHESPYFDAAWSAYVFSSEPYDEVFNILRDQYRYATERIGSRNGDAGLHDDPDKRLSEHLMSYYWRGCLELDDPILVSFWEKASDELRANAISFIGRALGHIGEESRKDILERLMRLWEARLFMANTRRLEHVKEMAAFGSWFVSKKFDMDWAIDQLISALQIANKVEPRYLIFKHIADAASTHPKEAIACLRMIAEGDKEGWYIYRHKEEVREILKIALGKPAASEEAKRVIHYLGSRGFIDYRDLLQR